MTSPETLRSDMEALAATLDDAKSGVAAGDALDLGGLDDRIGALCATVAALPPGEGRGFAEGLERLLGVLTRLGDTIEERRRLDMGEAEHAARRRAAVAYGQPTTPSAGAPAPPPSNDETP